MCGCKSDCITIKHLVAAMLMADAASPSLRADVKANLATMADAGSKDPASMETLLWFFKLALNPQPLPPG